MEYENMRVSELKVLDRDRELRNYSRMRKAELVALLQNNPPPSRSGGHRTPALRTRSPPPPPQRCAVYVTLKLDGNGCCRIHSVSDDGPSGPGAPWERVDSYRRQVCGYALEGGYQAWQKYDPRRGS